MGGDCNLNSSQMHTDSFKEILRQTMLNQEAIFREQVFIPSEFLSIMVTTIYCLLLRNYRYFLENNDFYGWFKLPIYLSILQNRSRVTVYRIAVENMFEDLEI